MKNKMAMRLFSLIFCFIILFGISKAQSYKIAVISNLEMSETTESETIIRLINDLNSQNNIAKLLLLGNLSKSGRSEEFDRLYSELEKLRIPYSLIGGRNDYSKNILRGSGIIQTWGDDQFIEVLSGTLFAGVNSTVPYLIKTGMFSIETLETIREISSSSSFENVFLFSEHSIDEIQNKIYLLNLLRNKNIISLIPSFNESYSLKKTIEEIPEISLPNSLSIKGNNYSIIELNGDSIFIFNRSIKNNANELVYRFSKNDLEKIKATAESEKMGTDSLLIKEWEINNNSSLHNKIIVSDNKIFSIYNNGLLYGYEHSGKEKWLNQLSGRVYNNFVHYKDLLLAATLEGDLYSINANNGDILQVVGIGENITSDLSLVDLAANGYESKGVVFGTSEGNIFCYDIFSFEIIWKSKISNSPILSKPFVTGDKIIFIDSFFTNYSINSNSGILLWKFEYNDNEQFNLKDFPLSDGKYVFSVSPAGEIFAIDLLPGKKIWSANKLNLLHKIYLNGDKQKLIVFTDKGEMILVSAKDGKEIHRLNLQKPALFDFNITELNNFMLVALSDGSVQKLNANNQISEIIKPDGIPISSINIIKPDKIVLSKWNGKLLLYKIRKQ